MPQLKGGNEDLNAPRGDAVSGDPSRPQKPVQFEFALWTKKRKNMEKAGEISQQQQNLAADERDGKKGTDAAQEETALSTPLISPKSTGGVGNFFSLFRKKDKSQQRQQQQQQSAAVEEESSSIETEDHIEPTASQSPTVRASS